jgi:tetratricopeptide (TPR) repeat protein
MTDSMPIKFECDEVEYTYQYERGSLYISTSFMKPDQGDFPKIYSALNDMLKDQDENLSTGDAFKQATLSKDINNKARSNTLIEMVLSRDPHNGRAFAMSIANLRSNPKKALEEFEKFKNSGGKPNKAVFTSVGAAYLDLGDIELARKYADRAHAMSGGRSQYTMLLYQAIQKEEERRARRG